MSKYFMILKTQFLTCRGKISNARTQELTLDNLHNAICPTKNYDLFHIEEIKIKHI